MRHGTPHQYPPCTHLSWGGHRGESCRGALGVNDVIRQGVDLIQGEVSEERPQFVKDSINSTGSRDSLNKEQTYLISVMFFL